MREVPPLDKEPGRKTPAKGVTISADEPTILLLTICAKDRKRWMAQKPVRESLERIWKRADAWLVGNYLLMPDHLHLFCAPRDLHFTVEGWVTFWKRQFTREHLNEDWAWQRSAFHHRLRNAREYEDKWNYVQENPIRKGLASKVEDWPYSGMIHELRW
jgi:putative transposase